MRLLTGDEPPPLAADLAEVAVQYPEWEFGEQWSSVASGTDYRSCWARRGSVRLTGKTPGILAAQLPIADSWPSAG